MHQPRNDTSRVQRGQREQVGADVPREDECIYVAWCDSASSRGTGSLPIVGARYADVRGWSLVSDGCRGRRRGWDSVPASESISVSDEDGMMPPGFGEVERGTATTLGPGRHCTSRNPPVPSIHLHVWLRNIFTGTCLINTLTPRTNIDRLVVYTSAAHAVILAC